MNRPPITPKRILIAAAVLLLISSQLPTGAATTIGSIPRAFVGFISKPATILQRMSATLRPGRAIAPDFTPGGDLVEQLAQANVYIDTLEQEILELRDVSQSLAQIDALLDLGGIRLVGANVLGFNGDLENPVITIGVGDKAGGVGESTGLREGLAVVWGAGLVGRIVSTSAQTSDVQLVTAADTKLQVRIAKPYSDGVSEPLPAFIQVAEGGRAFVTEDFAVDAPVEVGDLVHLADDSWQFRARGFIVGVVTEAGPHPDRPYLNKRVVIRPTLPLPSLTRVAVLVPVD